MLLNVESLLHAKNDDRSYKNAKIHRVQKVTDMHCHNLHFSQRAVALTIAKRFPHSSEDLTKHSHHLSYRINFRYRLIFYHRQHSICLFWHAWATSFKSINSNHSITSLTASPSPYMHIHRKLLPFCNIFGKVGSRRYRRPLVCTLSCLLAS